jgi:hypothetical protein
LALVILLAVAATAIGAYVSIIGSGFLLDDFPHLEYGYHAARGDWSGVVRAFTGVWTGTTDNLTSYRPLNSLTFCLDYFLWQFNASGYHLTNLLMFASCSMLTGMLMFEFALAYRTPVRLAAMLLAGLLFAVYPLHPEAVAWIIGRVDLQCTFFCLSSTYLYLLWRRRQRTALLAASLFCFACALPSKEMAVTQPIIIMLMELLLPQSVLGRRETPLPKRLLLSAPFWLVLAGFAIIRTCALGTVVGGYSGIKLKIMLQSLTLTDTWLKILFGVNEEVGFPQSIINIGFACWTVLFGLLILRAGERFNYWRTLLFLCAWAAVSELPTIQIWHVFPNLSGSRLLFLPSAPFCMVLPLVALCPFRISSNHGKLLRYLPILAGALALVGLAGTWYIALQANQRPWIEAGDRMRVLTEQVRTFGVSAPEGKVALLIDLPSDHSGAGMLARPEFLQKLIRPPLYDRDLTAKLITVERPLPGSHEFCYPQVIAAVATDPRVGDTFIYDESQGRYVPWSMPSGAPIYDVEIRPGSLSQSAPNSERIIWLPQTDLNPFAVEVISLEMKSDEEASQAAHRIQIVWRSEHQGKSWIDFSPGPFGQAVGNRIVFVPGCYRSWLLNGSIRQIGLRVTSPADTNIIAIHGDTGASIIPSLELFANHPKGDETTADQVAKRWLLSIPAGTDVSVKYDATSIEGAKKVCLFVTKSGVPLDDLASSTIPNKRKLSAKFIQTDRRGTVVLPAEALKQPGLHQVGLVSLDSSDKPIGFTSEPRTVLVR